MTFLQSSIIVYLFNSLWQLPLILAAAWLAARIVRRTGPPNEHRVWVVALFAEVCLPVCRINPGGLWQHAWALIVWARSDAAASGEVRVLIGAGSISNRGVMRIPAEILTAIVMAYAISVLYFSLRFLWGIMRTSAMLRQANPLPPYDDIAATLNKYSLLLGLNSGQVKCAISSNIYGPVTIGIRSPTLLLPCGFLERLNVADLDAVLAHEFAHIRRRDFARNLLYELLAIPIAWHPLLWLTRARLAESREMICDDMAANAVTGPQQYAQSLLRLASMLSHQAPARTFHAIGIFDANIFERRVMNLTQKHTTISMARRLSIAVACAAIVFATLASTMALRMDSVSAAQSQRPPKLHVKVTSLTLINRVNPVYPPEAKKAKIQGSVMLAAVISKEGIPEKLSVKSGPKELQKSALDAVRQWRWQPYLLNGEPVDLDTEIKITYALAG